MSCGSGDSMGCRISEVDLAGFMRGGMDEGGYNTSKDPISYDAIPVSSGYSIGRSAGYGLGTSYSTSA